MARRLVVDGRRLVAANLPPLRHQSVEGFDFGGSDGGSADLALAAVQLVLNRLNYMGPTHRLADGSHVFAAGLASPRQVLRRICGRRTGRHPHPHLAAGNGLGAESHAGFSMGGEDHPAKGVGSLARSGCGPPTVPSHQPMNQRDLLRDLGVEAKELCGLVETLTTIWGMRDKRGKRKIVRTEERGERFEVDLLWLRFRFVGAA